MKKIKIYFTDFWPNFNCRDNFIYHVLVNFYDVEIVEDMPDYVFYSVFGNQYAKYNCVRIFYTGENVRPDFRMCDYGIGFDDIKLNDRYIRYPLWRLFSKECDIVQKKKLCPMKDRGRKKFCNFIYSNGNASTPRDEFFYKLSEYKKVDSGGRHLNNIGESVKDKIEWCSQYKFSIAFENSSTPGYTTEKVLQAFAANTIPVYFGDPQITREFNPRAFINCHDYDNFDDVISRIKELDNNESKYMEMLEEPAINRDIIKDLDEAFINFLRNIFEQNPEQALRRGDTFDIKSQKNRKVDKIIVYGIGNSYEEFKDEIEKRFEVLAVTSSNPEEKRKYNNYIKNTSIDSTEYDYVLIFSNYEVDIANMLVNKRGIPHNKILLRDMVFNQKGIFYSLYSEDAIMYLLLNQLRMDCKMVSKLKYLEFGTRHPIRFNFTYSLYVAGADGILAETEYDMENIIRIARPRDVLMSDFISEDTDNEEIVINDLLEKIGYLPDIFVFNVESDGLEVLRRFDLDKIRPLIVAVGFGKWGSTQHKKRIMHLLQEKAYLLAVNNTENGVFIDGEILK